MSAATQAATPPALPRFGPGALLLLLISAALLLAWHTATGYLPAEGWWRAAWTPPADDPVLQAYHHAVLPRAAMALLAGAALGVAGTLLQQVLRNPLAEPATLGISAGAHLALALAMLWAPAWLAAGREWIALAGAAAAAALVAGISWRGTLAPATLVLAGLIIGLYLSSISAMMVLLSHDYLSQLFLWQSGSLQQNGWSGVTWLAPRVAGAVGLALLLIRPLRLLSLGEAGARALGLSVRSLRLAAVAVAVALSGFVSAAAGVIALVGLAAPWLARLTGVRGMTPQLLWSGALGAALLLLTDQLAQQRTLLGMDVPTGVATALLGAPLLLLLLLRLRPGPALEVDRHTATRGRPASQLMIPGVGLLLAASAAALGWGAGPDGWQWASAGDWSWIMELRAPRVAASAAAGATLAMVGALLQRVTGNPMASPEILGVSSGAVLGVIALFLIVPGFDRGAMTAAALGGAALTTAALAALSARQGFAPERMLLAGIGIATLLAAASSLFLASGDPRAPSLLAWIAGSTAHVTPLDAARTTLTALVLLVLGLAARRWLDILPLGAGVALSLGIEVRRVRGGLLLVCAAATTLATLVAGPLTFVGLLAPHLARLLGAHNARQHWIVSALLGALVMVFADWAGRNLIYPWPIPAGLIATLIGAPYLLWLLRRR